MKNLIRSGYLAVSMLMVLLMNGCTPASTPASVEQLPTNTASQPANTLEANMPLPVYIEKPPTPTQTPQPSLQTKGPYFVYFTQENLILRLVFVNSDGKGRKVIELPKVVSDAFAYGTLSAPDMRFVSPDGKSLAFYTGSAGEYGTLPAHGTADLTLNLLDLETGETQVITPLLSKEYPNNFVEAAKKLNDPDKTAETLYGAFVDGITQAIAWSPNGQYLAFAGQMDGWSSDLYLYDMLAKTIVRLSSGDQELQWINWSPNGKWIVHSSVYGVGEGTTFDIYAAAADGSTVRILSNNVLYDGIHDWINAQQYLEHDGQNGPGNYGLRLVDVDTGNITKIWDGSFYSYAVDRSSMRVAVFTGPDYSPLTGTDPNFVPAIYLFNLKTHLKSRVELPDSSSVSENIQSLGVGGQAFALQDENSFMLLSADGKWTKTDIENGNIYVSPNSKYWFTIALGRPIRIISADNTLIKTNINPFQNNGPISVSWRPDSSGAFLISGSETYSMNVPDGDMKLVETHLSENQNYDLTYGWINGQ